MISDVSQGLIQLRGDLGECVSLVEMQTQSIALIFTEGVQKSLDGRISDQLHTELGFHCRLRTGVECFRSYIEVDARVEVPRLEVTSAVDCAMVSHLDDPRTSRAFGRIEESSLAMNKQEHVLEQIVCLGRI